MTATLENITGLVAAPADELTWEVRFASANPALHHQLYVNGILAGWTDRPADRRLGVPAPAGPCQLVIVAVDADARGADLWDQLGLDLPGWVCPLAVQRPAWPAGLQLVVRGDHATGQIDPAPLAVEELTPAWLECSGWGLDAFGAGGLGLDGSTGPGLGGGAFGAGAFGVGARLLKVRLALAQAGDHQLQLTVVDPCGQASAPVTVNFHAAPPPAPAISIAPLAYDSVNHILQVQAT
jgi:hypothetical protein